MAPRDQLEHSNSAFVVVIVAHSSRLSFVNSPLFVLSFFHTRLVVLPVTGQLSIGMAQGRRDLRRVRPLPVPGLLILHFVPALELLVKKNSTFFFCYWIPPLF